MKPSCSYIPLVMLAAAAVLAGGCGGSSARVDVWAAGEMTSLTEGMKAVSRDEVYDASSRRVELFGGANETVSFQLVIDAGGEGAGDIRIAVSDLEGEGGAMVPAAAIRLWRMAPVSVVGEKAWQLRMDEERPGEKRVYDALIAMHNPPRPMKLGRGERLAVWVDVRIPRTARAGEYSGRITVSAAGSEERGLGLGLRVYDFVLPDTRGATILGAFDSAELLAGVLGSEGRAYSAGRIDRSDPKAVEALEHYRELMVLGQEHGLNLFDTRLGPVIKHDLDGRVRIDWTDYMAIVTPYLDGTAFRDRVGVAAWPIPLSDAVLDARYYGGEDDPEYVGAMRSIVSQTMEQFRRMGLEDRFFAWPIRGEVDGDYGRFMRAAGMIREAWGELVIMGRLPERPPVETGWQAEAGYGRLCDMEVPPAMLARVGEEDGDEAAPAMSSHGSHLRGKWLAVNQPPFSPPVSVRARAGDLRAVSWLAVRGNYAGAMSLNVLGWGEDDESGGSSAGGLNLEGGEAARLFWPGKDFGAEGVLASVRLKHLRRGLQDAGYLWLLRQRGKGETADLLALSLARYSGGEAAGDHYLDGRLDGWVRDSESWEMARRLMAEEIQAAVHPGGRTVQQALAQRVLWQRFDESTRTVRVEQVRSKVTRADDGRMEIEFELSLHNERGRALPVSARLRDMPAGYAATGGSDRLESLAAGGRGTLRLKMVGGQPATDAQGRLRVGAELAVGLDERRGLTLDVPVLVCRPIETGPVIDGDLSDWPLRFGNSASEFRLVGHRGRASGAAELQTRAFVLRDAENLYIGMWCQMPKGVSPRARAANTVQYEQLMAYGEDLVEVLLDPGRRGRSAEDMYHLVIKPNGVLLTGKGIASRPALGAWEHWPANVRVAVRQTDGVWLVELAIPLASLGEGARDEVWGVNFMRFAPATMESSSWAGPPRHYYDPRNLGTMLLMGREE